MGFGETGPSGGLGGAAGTGFGGGALGTTRRVMTLVTRLSVGEGGATLARFSVFKTMRFGPALSEDAFGASTAFSASLASCFLTSL